MATVGELDSKGEIDKVYAVLAAMDSKGENDKAYAVLAAMAPHIRKIEALKHALRKMKVIRHVITKCTETVPAGRHRVYGDCPYHIDSLRILFSQVSEEALRLSAQLDEEFGFLPGTSSLPAN